MTATDRRLADEEQISESREDAYKIVISISLVCAVVSMLTICLTVPTMYTKVHNGGLYTLADIDFCDKASSDIELELMGTADYVRSNGNRTRRSEFRGQAGAPRPGPVTMFAGNVGFQECPACCAPGDRGPPGDSGLPGMHGVDGPNGAMGRAGLTPNASCIPERIFEPPPCLPCPQGPRGPPGHPGFPGELGDNGIAGRPGHSGKPGTRGKNGRTGNRGPRGLKGAQGDSGRTPEAHIIPGPPGDSGLPGAWGHPGHAGRPGDNGFAGDAGERGWPGSPGQPGIVGPFGPLGPMGEAGPAGTPGTCVCQETEVIVEDTLSGYHQSQQSVSNAYGGGYKVAALRMAPGTGDKEEVVVPVQSPKTIVHESNSGVIPQDVKVIDASHVEQVNQDAQFAYGRE